jgi:hypothetical protein
MTTFTTEELMEASKKSFLWWLAGLFEQEHTNDEQRRRTELQMALAREECRAQYIEKHLLPVVLKNPDWKSIFTPGWSHQPGVKVHSTSTPGWCLQPGVKVYLYSRLVSPTGSKGPCMMNWSLSVGLYSRLVAKTGSNCPFTPGCNKYRE